ncbi:Alpha/Beta hydrolase protein [Dichotomocladium elegans]|nr:Alpha/Beta hydrolase protein [Dichotomocladium elegans]
MVEIKPYGAWPSPVTPDSLSAGISATDLMVDGEDVYWNEVIPAEQGRGQIFFKTPVDTVPLLPAGYSCADRVHEYGRGTFAVKNGLVVFSNDSDSRLYTIREGTIAPLTADSNNLLRYGDMRIDDKCEYVVCIQEQHFENEQPKDVINRLVSVRLSDGSVHPLAEGYDFYASPRLHGDQLAYVCWKHSNMPWDFTELHVGTFTGTSIEGTKFIAGNEESVAQPEWGLDGTLYFVSDRSGFWNIYKCSGDEVKPALGRTLDQEFADAAWRFNNSWYTPSQSDPTKLVCINKSSLAIMDTEKQTLTNIEALRDYVSFEYIRTMKGPHGDIIVTNATSTHAPCQIVAVDDSGVRVIREGKAPALDLPYVSLGEEIEFPTENGLTAYAYYYPPKNPNYEGPKGELPPLRVLSHGGPTSSVSGSYNRSIQFWTTRGFGIVDVNYGGSTGYGRTYRNRLKKMWGIVDVDDCCNAARYLVKQGRVDGNKLTIEGGSAGGYTTLYAASLAFRDVFKAGCCQYGISDITLLAKETHKFESRYPGKHIKLIGEYPKDEAIYKERSPLFSADKIKCPVIFFQGAEDKVVPPSQAEVMVNALKENGVPVAYVLYPEEAHGFRRAENITRTVELELWFYGQIFGFPVEGVDGVEIYNFSK